ncbi:ArsR family transcriptional regulator protein [Marine Group I thaumarchaeote SCGC AAA799-P11]|uniref:ArsR family transcriptional regulator protein n=1 Tax=Marine Group I thaumarchaeote SCGC AAA799-P11 TaxID=1502295 RepID=A0A087S3F9_9ARCH|nr:ArsR family transcriptional regulator protein [Marine Group I thaumarchaeote SCGC AAA799-P11]
MIRGEIRNNQILDLIQKNPGLNFCDIMRITGFKNGVLSYYVKKLEKNNMVHVIRKTGNTRFFPLEINEHESVLLEMLRRPTPCEIILLLENNPEGLSVSQIIQYTKKAQSTISIYLQLLLSRNVTMIKFHSRKKIIVLKDIEHVRTTLQKYNFKPIKKTIQNFNDMFESL